MNTELIVEMIDVVQKLLSVLHKHSGSKADGAQAARDTVAKAQAVIAPTS